MTPIAIIILNLNQREKTLQCLASLAQAKGQAQRVLLWDNGSRDDTAAAVRRAFPDVVVHEHPSNLGVASGRNAAALLAIQSFQPSHLLFLDNDMLVEDGFVEELHQPFRQDERVGQTQAKLRFMYDRERLNDGGGGRINFLIWQITPVGFGEIDRGQHDRVKKCISCGGAMMVRSDVFRELGGFDTRFDPFGPEDLDFSLRLQEAGYLALYTPRAVAYHAVSNTFGKGYSETYARHKFTHWLIFMRRHATPLQRFGFYTVGAPWLAVRLVIRAGRRGNLAAVRGIARGVWDSVKLPLKKKPEPEPSCIRGVRTCSHEGES